MTASMFDMQNNMAKMKGKAVKNPIAIVIFMNCGNRLIKYKTTACVLSLRVRSPVTRREIAVCYYMNIIGESVCDEDAKEAIREFIQRCLASVHYTRCRKRVLAGPKICWRW
jgi:hypothetical protein